MDITFTRTTTYTLSVDDDDDATLTTITELLVLAEVDGDSLYEKLCEVCHWDSQDGLKALVSLAVTDDDDDTYEVTDYDIDGLEPSEEEEDADALT